MVVVPVGSAGAVSVVVGAGSESVVPFLVLFFLFSMGCAHVAQAAFNFFIVGGVFFLLVVFVDVHFFLLGHDPPQASKWKTTRRTD